MSPAAITKAAVLTQDASKASVVGLLATRAAAERAGCTLYAPREEIEELGVEAEGLQVLEDLDGVPELCIALGGDGTILKGLRRYADTEVPVFGINYGTVGFLAAAEADELEKGLASAFAADFETIALPALEAGPEGTLDPALNDVSFTRRPHARVAELSYRLGGREVGHVRCDGLVAATPVGSTGYNLANGGPILAWGVEGYVVSFIAPHTLTSRPLVVAPGDVLHVHNVGARDAVDVAVDGVEAGELEPGSMLEIRFRDDRARLAQLAGETFYGRIREKFGRLTQ